MTERTLLSEGEKAPAFKLLDQDGNDTSLKDFAGRKVILYFYPEAMTPACAKQACDFRDSLASLQAAGYEVLGVSPDAPARLKKFQERDGLTFKLLSDPDRKVQDAYGVYGEKQNYGRTYLGLIRSTFVIDEKGKLSRVLYNVKATGHVAMLRKQLGLD